MLIPVDVLNLLRSLVSSTPIHTPNRNEFIRHEIRKYVETINIEQNKVEIVQIKNFHSFEVSDNDCIDQLIRSIPRLLPVIPGHDIILIPSEQFCCKRGYHVDPRHSTIRI